MDISKDYISSGESHVVVIDKNGKLLGWGKNDNGQITSKIKDDKIISSVNISDEVGGEFGNRTFSKISSGNKHSLALDDTGNIWVWGSNRYGQIGNNQIQEDINGLYFRIYNGYYDDDYDWFTDNKINENKTSGYVSDFTNISTATNGELSSFTNTSVEWIGYFKPNETGTWIFYTSSDDASHLFIDDKLIINNGGTHGIVEKNGDIDLVKDVYYKIRILYGNKTGGLGFTFSFSGPNTNKISDGSGFFYNIEKIDPYKINIDEIQFKEISTGGYHNLAIDTNGKLWGWGNNNRGQVGKKYENGLVHSIEKNDKHTLYKWFPPEWCSNADILLVGGGAGGGARNVSESNDGIFYKSGGSGGGGGEVKQLLNYNINKNSYIIEVGRGGNGGTEIATFSYSYKPLIDYLGKPGNYSSFDYITCNGGYPGGEQGSGSIGGKSGSGKSGGDPYYTTINPWNGYSTTHQIISSGNSAGGAGAGNPGGNATIEKGGVGGDGLDVSTTFGGTYGDDGWFGGGGAGKTYSTSDNTEISGGKGGGASIAGSNGDIGVNALEHSGGGGSGKDGKGGNGIVIIKAYNSDKSQQQIFVFHYGEFDQSYGDSNIVTASNNGRYYSNYYYTSNTVNSPENISEYIGGTFANKTFVKISCGLNHSMALDSDGDIWAWGDNTFLQLGIDISKGEPRTTEDWINEPVNISNIHTELKNIVEISSNYLHNIILNTNGDIWGWGSNDYFQLFDSYEELVSVNSENSDNTKTEYTLKIPYWAKKADIAVVGGGGPGMYDTYNHSWESISWKDKYYFGGGGGDVNTYINYDLTSKNEYIIKVGNGGFSGIFNENYVPDSSSSFAVINYTDGHSSSFEDITASGGKRAIFKQYKDISNYFNDNLIRKNLPIYSGKSGSGKNGGMYMSFNGYPQYADTLSTGGGGGAGSVGKNGYRKLLNRSTSQGGTEISIGGNGGDGIDISNNFGNFYGEKGWFGGGGAGMSSFARSKIRYYGDIRGITYIQKGGEGGGASINISHNLETIGGIKGTPHTGGGGAGANRGMDNNNITADTEVGDADGGSGIVLVKLKNEDSSITKLLAFHYGNHDGFYGDVDAQDASSKGRFFADYITEKKYIYPFKINTTENADFNNSVITQIETGYSHNLLLDEQNNVWSWGSNYINNFDVSTDIKYYTNFTSGSLGTNDVINYDSPQNIKSQFENISDNIQNIYTGAFHSIAIDKNDNIWSWGINTFGQLGNNDLNLRKKPETISKSFRILEKPGQPTNLQTTSGSTNVEINWNDIEPEGSPQEVYNISILEYDNTPVNSTTGITRTTKTASFTDLQPSSIYKVSIDASNELATGGSITTQFSTVVDTPINLQTTAGSTNVEINWNDIEPEGSPQEVYNISILEYDNTPVDSTTGITRTTTTASFTDLEPSSIYTVTIDASNELATGGSLTTQFSTVVDTPSNLQTTAGSTNVEINWEDIEPEGSPQEVYNITISDYNDRPVNSTTGITRTTTTASFTDLQPSSIYTVSIDASNELATGESLTTEFSTVVDTPSNLQTTAGSTNVEINWEDIEPEGSPQEVYNISILEYDNTPVNSTTGITRTTTTASFTDLQPSSIYTVSIDASNELATGGSITTQFSTVVDTPINLQTTAGSTNVEINWEDITSEGSPQEVYNISISDYDDRPVDSTTGITRTTTTASFTDLQPSSIYTVSIDASNELATGGSITTQFSTVVEFPTKINIIPERNSVEINWEDIIPEGNPQEVYNVTIKDMENIIIDSHLNISRGTQTVSFTGLKPSTIYKITFQIFNELVTIQQIEKEFETKSYIFVNNSFVPSDTDKYDLGSETNRFRDLYLSGNSNLLGDLSISGGITAGGLNIEPLIKNKYIIAVGRRNSLALDNAGGVWAWGSNFNGQLGNGTNLDSNVAVDISGNFTTGTEIVSVVAGYYHSLAVDKDGGVWAWGYNVNGQLGNGTTTDSNVPIDISGNFTTGTEIVSVAGGEIHSLALDNAGGVWAWGDNELGQLGNGTNLDSNVPVDISGNFTTGTEIVSVAAGSHSLALDKAGGVWAWGDNRYGGLGNGKTTNSNVPIDISGNFTTGTEIVSVAAGGYHSLALDNAGGVWAWGYNNYGQLGDRTTNNSNDPIDISGNFTSGTEIVSVAAGRYHSLAVDKAGGVWAWGANYTGQLGNGTNNRSNVPIDISGNFPSGTEIVSVAAGFYHNLAVDKAGKVWAWGRNFNGQLGNGTTNSSNVPIDNIRDFKDVIIKIITDYALTVKGDISAGGLDLSSDINVSGTINTQSKILEKSNVLIPAGTIFASASSNNPSGWLECNGSNISRTTYSDLFSAIGTTWGSGDRVNTFTLPDFRGRTLIGAGGGWALTNRILAQTGGAETHTITKNQMPSHNHGAGSNGAGSHSHNIKMGNTDDYNFSSNYGQRPVGDSGGSNNRGIYTDSAGHHSHTITVYHSGGGQAHNNMQPFSVVKYFIKY